MYTDAHTLSEQKSGVNLLQIRSQNPGKYALSLLDALLQMKSNQHAITKHPQRPTAAAYPKNLHCHQNE